MVQEKGNWKPYNVKAIVNNVELIFKAQDISKLNKPVYEFISQHMGFIAHYDLYGFQSVYEDLRDFAEKLQSGELSKDRDYNLNWADSIATDSQFREWYGEAYNKSKVEVIRGIVAVARKYQEVIDKDFGAKQKKRELALAFHLAQKHGYEVRAISS